MKKLFITGVVLCSAIILIGAQTGFAWIAYDGGCQNCHGTGFAALNTHGVPAHSASACTICHVISGDVPATSKCIVCHPAADPGVCPLIIAHPEPPQATCLGCHTALSGCSAPTTTTTVPTDCITIDPTSVTVNGVNDQTLDVIVTFTSPDVINIPPEELNELVINVDTTCAQYITINSSTINIGTAVTANLNITVQGDAPASECSIKVSDPTGVANPPLNCEASFTIISSPITTTTTVPITTTTIPQTDCTVTVTPSPAFLKLKSAFLRPVIRRIAIKGDGSNFEDYTAVSIEDIPIVIKLRTQNPEGLFALIVIPPRIFGRFEPGTKDVGVVTGSEFCSGTVEIE